ncbi:hypothetical protein GCM10010156_66530 [Planobispora rosea]|uniref:Uncharacterized protein n=1 Tax=Planobispora rosea TaxID=35762 RepID=A0A8J3S417_PLARO|nr:hypothetical protein [Planobispora rosea]GGS99077.1 hypothetical protein GCM10010156_66530 [Planobispora rosea]GIH88016.1 hypothetical protein Pro02_64240 [Planobispora rosea]
MPPTPPANPFVLQWFEPSVPPGPARPQVAVADLFTELHSATRDGHESASPADVWLAGEYALPRWERIDDMRTPGRSHLVEAGPARMNGAAMHGLYRRPMAPGADEVVAYWQGHLLWHWQEAKVPQTLPDNNLLSAWNLILAEGLSRPGELTPYGSEVDRFTNAWKSRAVLSGYLPYADFRLPTDQAVSWCAAAERARLPYDREPDAMRGYQRIIAALPQTYGQLFDVGAIAAAYAAAGLPALAAASQLAALREHHDIPLSVYASVELPLAHAPLVIQGLTLGHPVTMTLPHAWDALPVIPVRAPFWDAGEAAATTWPGLRGCDHPGRHESLEHLDAERGSDLVDFARDYYHDDFAAEGRPTALEDLIRRPYLVAVAYRRYLATFTPTRRAIGSQLHRLICCLLRGMATSRDELPEALHLEAKIGRARRLV